MAYRLGALLMVIFLLLEGNGFSQDAQNDYESRSFSCEGQSAFNAGDLAQSRTEAVKNMFEQVIAQAIGTLVGPAALEAHSAAVKSRILRRSESYVQNYQVSSEAPEGEVYKIRGQVSVAMDMLISDLQALGLRVKKDPLHGSEEPQSGEVAPGQEGEASPDAESGAGAASTSELPRFKQRILWAVAEKRDGVWRISRDSGTPEDILATSMIQESEMYDISLLFPDEGVVQVDAAGAIAEKTVMASARAAGTRAVVLGTAVLESDRDRRPRLKASLRMLNTSSSLTYGEVQFEHDIGDNGAEEGTMEMAGIIAARLDRLLREAPRPAPETAGGIDTGSRISIGNVETITLIVHGYQQISNWEEIENALREDFKSLKIDEIELGPDTIKARMGGIDSQLPERLQRVRLRNGLQVQVKGYSAQDSSLDIALVPEGATKSEQ